MFIIFGTKAQISPSPTREILSNTCPRCSGNLELQNYKKWFTLFWVPVFPYHNQGGVYICNQCGSVFNKTDRPQLLAQTKDKEQKAKEGEKWYACTLAACTIHLTQIENPNGLGREEELDKIKSMFYDWKQEIDDTILLMLSEKRPDEQVLNFLRKSSQLLPQASLLELIQTVVNNTLSKNRLSPKQKEAVEDYLLVSGFSKNKLNDIIEN